ncbi:MAG: pyruvate, phosphate dikinase [Acidobacteria bacterium]|nr:MAG: pyruvate, phosphate dikinase [Acidobacteriota bacterium]
MAKYVFSFGEGKADGNGKMKDELGGKGAGLAEMTNAGLPVPPGFTLSTATCREYYKLGNRVPEEADTQMRAALEGLQRAAGQKLGDAANPLLVSVRSGAKFSMPGMMDTILNLGLNDQTVAGLAKRSQNPRFAYDSYRRLMQMFGNVVQEIPKDAFDAIFDGQKKRRRVKLDTDLNAADLQAVIAGYKKLIQKHTGKPFPQDAVEQLTMARDAVFRSWFNDRARHYRRMNNISEDLGTAVNVQAMVFGNLGETSGTGVGFTRNPATGEKEFYGEFLMNAQGEDVVAGIRTPVPIRELEKQMPNVYQQLRDITTRLERHYRDMQDFEFTIQDGRLYMLQTRNGKRTGRAAVKLATDMVNEGLITKVEAVFRVDANQVYELLFPRFDPKQLKNYEPLAHGLPASPGAAVGQIVFTADAAVAWTQKKKGPVLLVRAETTPEDIHGMEVAAGILTSRGGMTSHAAVVTRGMGKCCVAGASGIVVDEHTRKLTIGKRSFAEGAWISIDGSSGNIYAGQVPTVPGDPKDPLLQAFMAWAEPHRKIGVRANADIPRDAKAARSFGAEGIGLCRTEHMFFGEGKIEYMRAMILADDEKQRRAALRKLLPLQRRDFAGIFEAMDGFPVTIRTLDPPLHEFLPQREEILVDRERLRLTSGAAKRKVLAEIRAKYKDYAVTDLASLEHLLARVQDLHEVNPMLGLRGCRLGILYPEITEMQARAIFEAAVQVQKKGKTVKPEVMIPLVGTAKELALQAAIVRRVADEVLAAAAVKLPYLVGTMIELPRAALVAGEIAAEAQFFSFGTNDLTQTTYGFSRDDIGKILPVYFEQGVLKQDPFASIDQGGVGQLVQMGTERGRRTRPDLKVGICGEHGGDPESVKFFHRTGLNYVSCSPYRVLTARLAAAQAGASDEQGQAARTA